jgi:hypothetical protein
MPHSRWRSRPSSDISLRAGPARAAPRRRASIVASARLRPNPLITCISQSLDSNAAHAIRRLEEAGFTHQQATGVVEVVQGEVIEHVAARDYVGEQIALVRKEVASQAGAVRQEIAPPADAVGAALLQEPSPDC